MRCSARDDPASDEEALGVLISRLVCAMHVPGVFSVAYESPWALNRSACEC